MGGAFHSPAPRPTPNTLLLILPSRLDPCHTPSYCSVPACLRLLAPGDSYSTPASTSAATSFAEYSRCSASTSAIRLVRTNETVGQALGFSDRPTFSPVLVHP